MPQEGQPSESRGEGMPPDEILKHLRRLLASLRSPDNQPLEQLGATARDASTESEPGSQESDFMDPEASSLFTPDISHFRRGLALGAALGEMTREEMREFVETSRGLNAVYSDRRVPRHFVDSHPNIRFVSPTIEEGFLRGDPFEHNLRWYLADFYRVFDKPILDSTTLINRLLQLQAHTSPPLREKAETIAELMIGSYLDNLELYRLTQDPNGKLKRFTNTPDVQEETLWWNRADITPEEAQRLGHGGNTVIHTTVSELERGHIITLDNHAPLSIFSLVATRTTR